MHDVETDNQIPRIRPSIDLPALCNPSACLHPPTQINTLATAERTTSYRRHIARGEGWSVSVPTWSGSGSCCDVEQDNRTRRKLLWSARHYL